MPDVVYSWGHNADGQLGNGTTDVSNTPKHVKSVDGMSLLTGIKAISASRHSLALASNQTVLAWGRNKHGELGDGTDISRTTPVKVLGLNNIKAISTGRLTLNGTNHSLALRADGKVFAWGANETGQLGNDSNSSSNTPVQVKGVNANGVLSDIVAVSGGRASSFAIGSNGNLFAWGDNQYGQLGDGTTTNRKTPIQVGLLSDITAVSGDLHSLALRSDGTLFTWGNNQAGQLGNGTTADSETPKPLISKVVAVSAGKLHSLILRSDGTVFAWGSNQDGQLGNGTTNNSTFPGIVGLSNIIAVSSGSFESCALRSDGKVFAWGRNTDGQLGNGTFTSSSTPVQVALPFSILAVSMGNMYVLAIG